MIKRRLVGFSVLCAVLAGISTGGILAADRVLGDLLPLGDGKISPAPRAGYVFSCRSRFGGGGAFRDGNWIQGNGWDPKAKIHVEGSVIWPNARIDIALNAVDRIVSANNLPLHPTGIFPIQPDDPAHAYDRNPNQIREQDILLRLPRMPRVEATASCLPMGMVGFALTGVAIFNALDAMGQDAPAHEILDACDGHPQRDGQYHYHNLSNCLSDMAGAAGRHSDLLGYALDGFGIFGFHGEDGEIMFSADLDECHGHVHQISWDGRQQRIYHYHMTPDFPYTLGCFRGAVDHSALRNAEVGRQFLTSPPPMRQTGDRHHVLEQAAHELGIDVWRLRDAIGPPPPDFRRASQLLGMDEQRLRQAMQNARDQVMPAPPPYSQN